MVFPEPPTTSMRDPAELKVPPVKDTEFTELLDVLLYNNGQTEKLRNQLILLQQWVREQQAIYNK